MTGNTAQQGHVLLAVCLVWALPSLCEHVAAEDRYELTFLTYVGGKNWEHARDICTDRHGNIYHDHEGGGDQQEGSLSEYFRPHGELSARGYKHESYEGGISTPFIVHWPNGIPAARRKAIVHEPSHLIDMMPTFVEAAGAKYPEEVAGTSVQPMEGVSLIPALAGKLLERNAPLGFEHHGNLGLRDGRWKIVSAFRRDQPRKWELYDMVADRTELNDLSTTHPERLQELVRKWQSWADRVGVQPWPFKPKRR